MPTLILNVNRIRTMNKQIVLKLYSLRLRPSSVVNFVHCVIFRVFSSFRFLLSFIVNLWIKFRFFFSVFVSFVDGFYFTIFILCLCWILWFFAECRNYVYGAFTCNSCILDYLVFFFVELFFSFNIMFVSCCALSIDYFFFLYVQ